MAAPRASLRQGGRPSGAILYTVLLALSLAGLYVMRISTAINDVPRGFQQTVEAGVFENGVALKREYTGIAGLDAGLSFLVVAFLGASTGWNECFRLQSIHFLLSFSAVLVVCAVESCRVKNKGKWITFTSLSALFYQGVGGAVIVPLWVLAYHYASSSNSYFASGRAVPLPYARALLPCLGIYLALTFAMYYPTDSLDFKQNMTALWQPAPILANIPLWIASAFVSSQGSGSQAKTDKRDLPFLKNLYLITFLFCIFSHFASIFAILTSSDPLVSLTSVFIPNQATWRDTLDWGLLHIFQWDWILIGSAALVMSWIAVWDVQRLTRGNVGGFQLVQNAAVLAIITVIGGPGATLAGVWGWRENSLEAVESRLKEKK